MLPFAAMKAPRLAVTVAVLALGACSKPAEAPRAAAASPAAPAASASPAAEEALPPPRPWESDLPESVRALMDRPFQGDLDQMVERRIVRAGVTFNRTHYFIDGGAPRGISYEYLRRLEDELNAKEARGHLKVHVVFVPLPRDLLLPALTQGRVDLVVAQLTVTPERQRLVDFTDATREDVSEVLVGAPGTALPARLENLSGREVFVRATSSYHASLLALNQKLAAQGRPPVQIRAAPEELEDDDILEMVNAGLVETTVVDDYLARFWKQVFPRLVVREDLAVRSGGRLAVAIRKHSPKLAAACNAFIRKNGAGSTFGRVVEKRYLQATTYVKGATARADRQRFESMVELFRKYGEQYGLDYLLMAAQGYQESRLDQKAKSRVGAIGVMQVMPATGREMKVGDVRKLEPNIHAGVKYVRFMIDQYFADEPMTAVNKGLFAFASYNAGPGRVRQLRAEARRRGLDPNVWFGNVEVVAAERIGRETVTYVSSIYKYYVAYRLVAERQQQRQAAQAAVQAR